MPVRAACAADQASAGHLETVQVVMLTPRTSNLPPSVVSVDEGVSKSGGMARQLFFARALAGLEEGGRVAAVSTFAFHCDTGYGFARLAKPQACTADTG